MLFDTHAHLDDKAFDKDRDRVIKSIMNSDVSKVVNAAASVESSHKSIELADNFEFIYASVGIHPHEAKSITDEDIRLIESLAQHRKVVAIGEIGLDYYYDFAPKDLQKKWFIEQIGLAEKLNLPYIVHSRDAAEDTFNIIKEHTKKSKFVLHCFSQSKEMMKRYLDLGGYISFAGTLTFKNAVNLKEALKAVPLDRLLIETDSPYLTPVPFRGKRNSPEYVRFVAMEASKLLQIPYEEICKITYDNAMEFFNIKDN